MTDHPSIHSVTQEKQWGGWGGGQWLVWWESSHGITQLTFQKIKLRISVFLAPTNLVQVWPMHSQMWPKSTFSKISKFLFVKCWKTNLFASCETTAPKVSFERSDHRILCTDSKVGTTSVAGLLCRLWEEIAGRSTNFLYYVRRCEFRREK